MTFASLRPFQEADARALSDLYRRSVLAMGPRRYNAEQVAAWAAIGPAAESVLQQAQDGRLTLLAVDAEDRPLAYADLEADGHIDFFYAAPEASGRGIAAALYLALETEARAAGIARLYVEASAIARGFFARQGFTVLHRRDFTIGDTPIYNFAMEKLLA